MERWGWTKIGRERKRGGGGQVERRRRKESREYGKRKNERKKGRGLE